MAYEHKKSLRVLTDKQFSRNTSVGGTRLDDALEESVNRFNAVPRGDLSTRFTKSQFVFGYTPSPVTANPVCQRSAVPPHAFHPVAPILRAGTTESLPSQWIALPNSKHTTVKTTSTAPAPYPGRYKNQDGATPTGGFQNEWKVKGTNIEEYPDGRPAMSNQNAYPNQDWLDYWADRTAGGGAVATDAVDTRTSYQLAWTQSWQFERPVIIDELFVSVEMGALFNILLGYDDTSGNTLPSRNLCVVLHVDNDVAKEDRSANSIEATFNNRPVFMSYVAMGTPMASLAYTDMFPNHPHYSGGLGPGYPGRVIRFRDMNIPVRQFSRVRLSLVLPEYALNGDSNNKKGWHRLLSTHISMQASNNDDNVSVLEPNGLMSPLNACVNGSLTVLEEVQR